VRSTLTRKWRDETRSREDEGRAPQNLQPEQEAELLPPARGMLRETAISRSLTIFFRFINYVDAVAWHLFVRGMMSLLTIQHVYDD
jgi:hypothetical protein